MNDEVLATFVYKGDTHSIVKRSIDGGHEKFILFDADGEEAFSSLEPFTVGLARSILNTNNSYYELGRKVGQHEKAQEIRAALKIVDPPRGDSQP